LSIDDVYIPVNSALAGFNRQTLGINFPYLMPNGKDFPNKIPTVSVPNFYGLAGGPYPSHSSGTIWTGSDTLTKVWNNHTIKAGFSFEYSGENDGDQINVSTVPGGASNQNGTFYFTDGRTGLGATAGVGMANLALGLADSYTEIGPRSLPTNATGRLAAAYSIPALARDTFRTPTPTSRGWALPIRSLRLSSSAREPAASPHAWACSTTSSRAVIHPSSQWKPSTTCQWTTPAPR
jgi:hypothetical protein